MKEHPLKTSLLHGGRTPLGLCVVASFLALTLAAPVLRAASKTTGAIPPSSINVKDFGAKGDGVTDDTAAIQAAVVAAAERAPAQAARIYKWRLRPRSAIVFPAGTYRISAPIAFERQAVVRGIGETTIVQDDPEADIFYFYVDHRSARKACNFFVEDLNFKGGKTHLRFWTNNTGNARNLVDHCTFTGSSDYAIVCQSWLKPKWNDLHYGSLSYREKRAVLKKGLYWPPYLVETVDGRVKLTPNPNKPTKRTNNSTLTVISNSRFDRCMAVSKVTSDMLLIRDVSVEAHPQRDGPIFWLSNAKLYRVKGHAQPAEGKQPFWLAYQGGRRSVRDSSFSSSRGMDFIHVDHASSHPVLDNLVVDQVRVNTAGGPANAPVWIPQENVPAIMSLTGMTETSGQPVRAIAWENPDNSISPRWGGYPIDQIKIALARNSDNIDTTLPESVQPARVEAVPKKALKETFVSPLTWAYRDLEDDATTVLHAGEHGVDDEPQTDDTAAIQSMFDAVSDQGRTLVIFPAGIYRLSEAIRLPANVLLRGAGMAAFEMKDSHKDVFVAKNARALGFKNLVVQGGRYAFNIETDTQTEARIGFDACWISQPSIGIRCMAGQGKVGQPNRTQLRFSRGTLEEATQAVVTNAARSQIESSWLMNGSDLPADTACIVNRGGAMRVQWMLGNPRRPDDGEPWRNNVRWIDNFGRLYAMDNRFGGEGGGGITTVHNRSTEGAVYVGGGMVRCLVPQSTQCILYMEKDPKVAVIEGIATEYRDGGRYEGTEIYGRPSDRAGKANLFVSGVLE